jgi:predicted lactoylglutathione lyase
MIKVVVRHCSWNEPEEIGEFSPSEVKDVINLIKENGVYASEGNDTLEKFEYDESYYNLDNKYFEIIVE